MRSGSAQTRTVLGAAGDADVGLGGGGVLEGGGAHEEIFGGAHGELEVALAGGDAFEVEDVVDEADEAVGVAEGDLEHLPHLVGAADERTTTDEAEGGAEAGERGAELVGDGGDELVLHAIEGAALGGVGEGDDDPDGLAGAIAVGLDLGAGDVLDGEGGAVFAPEDLVGDADGGEVLEAVGDGALGFGVLAEPSARVW